MRILLNHGELVVIETDDDVWLGTAEVVDGTFVVRSGYVGRPVVLEADDVVSMVPATESEDVEMG
jgi:hypothetical protein